MKLRDSNLIDEKGLKSTFEAILAQANLVLNDISTIMGGNALRSLGFDNLRNSIIVGSYRVLSDTEGLLASFNEARNQFEIAAKRGLGVVKLEQTPPGATRKETITRAHYNLSSSSSTLRQLVVECTKAVTVLAEIISPIPPMEQRELESLRKELFEMSTSVRDRNLIVNLETAIAEYEKGHYLAAGLVSGRVVRFIFEKIPAQGIEAKLTYLQEKTIVSMHQRDTVALILKADNEARNMTVHDVAVFPGPKEVMSLIADALRVLEFVWLKLQDTICLL